MNCASSWLFIGRILSLILWTLISIHLTAIRYFKLFMSWLKIICICHIAKCI